MDKILLIPYLIPDLQLTQQQMCKIQMENITMLWGFKSIFKFNLTQRSSILSMSRLLFYSIQYSIVLHKIKSLAFYNSKSIFLKRRKGSGRKKQSPSSPLRSLPIPLFCIICAIDHPYKHPCQLSPAKTCYRHTQSSSVKEWDNKQRSSPAKHIAPKLIRSPGHTRWNRNTETYRRSAEAQGNYKQKGNLVKNKLGN